MINKKAHLKTIKFQMKLKLLKVFGFWFKETKRTENLSFLSVPPKGRSKCFFCTNTHTWTHTGTHKAGL